MASSFSKGGIGVNLSVRQQDIVSIVRAEGPITGEAIAKRLETYEKETAPLLDIYESRGLLVVVNGVGDIDEISGRIISHLE